MGTWEEGAGFLVNAGRSHVGGEQYLRLGSFPAYSFPAILTGRKPLGCFPLALDPAPAHPETRSFRVKKNGT